MLKIYPSFFLMLMLAVIFRDTGYMLSLLLSSLFHECGHIIAFKICKVGIKEFALKMGRLSLTPLNDMSPLKKIIIAAMGPMFSFILCGVMLLIKRIDILHEFAERCTLVSSVLGTFNLLPIQPLDGGRIIEGVLAYKGIYTGRRVSFILSAALLFAGALCKDKALLMPGIMLTLLNLPIKGKGIKNANRKNGKAFVQGAKARPLYRRRTKPNSKG